MKKYEEQLSPEAVLLNKYLNQYKRCIERKKDLERRQKEIVWELQHVEIWKRKTDQQKELKGCGQ